jgi:hypothetical protein
MSTEKANHRRAADTRADRVKLTAEESLRRMEEFPKRKEDFIASVRKGKGRGIYRRRS